MALKKKKVYFGFFGIFLMLIAVSHNIFSVGIVQGMVAKKGCLLYGSNLKEMSR